MLSGMESQRQSGVEIGELTSHRDRIAAAELLAEIWGVPSAESPVPADLMTALGHAGGCVLGAWTTDGTLAGVTIGFAGAPGSERVYSYIAGVAAGFAGQGLGRLLKLAQRDWALDRGATVLVWTYDPLIRRNGHFNLNRLGGRVTEFVRDYYPPMLDAVNAGDLPDRFVVEWTLAEEPGGRALPVGTASAPVVLECGEGDEPVVRRSERGGWAAGADAARVWVPSDIERLRAADPALGRRWRVAAREVFGELFAEGFRPVGMTADGCYVLAKES